MAEKKVEIQKTLEPRQVAAFLRLLADEIEGGRDDGLRGLGVSLHNFNRIKVGLVRQQGGHLTLKLKIRDSAPTEGAMPPAPVFEDLAETKYRPLKKQFRSTFAVIREAAQAGRVPSASDLESFLEEARLVVSYPGFGDEHYAPFVEACEAVREAGRSGDVQVFVNCVNRVVELKRACHQRYK